jgi:hypothetical protein
MLEALCGLFYLVRSEKPQTNPTVWPRNNIKGFTLKLYRNEFQDWASPREVGLPFSRLQSGREPDHLLPFVFIHLFFWESAPASIMKTQSYHRTSLC